MREQVKLVCTECKEENYDTSKNKKLNPELETVFVTANAENMYLSSSVVKQVCEFGGDISEFVPEQVCDDIIKRIKERNRFSK